MRTFVSLLLTCCLLVMPLTVIAKKGDAHFKKGLKYETAQQWEKAAQEFTLAIAADPSNTEYQLHFRRASFNASQAFMQQGRALAEQRDYVGAYNSFRQAYGYDPVNTLSVSEMERMLRLQTIKEGNVPAPTKESDDNGGGGTPASGQMTQESVTSLRPTQNKLIILSGDLKTYIRKLADELDLNVVFDRQSFAQPRTIDLTLKDVTTAQALDYIFLQEGLFFQRLSHRTILVAEQSRRAQYQQLVLRTFFLSNTDPEKAQRLISQAIPPSVGRPSSIVVPDKDTNTLTVRDTAENVRLIGDLLQSIDKERPEVVMDVNIYEVNKSDLLQLGNQIGTASTNLGGSPGFAVLSNAGVLNNRSQGVNLSNIIGSVPTGFAAALVFPPSVLTAFQSKNRGKLIASTQVHAFNNEESTARIGQRVPVQTAQAYPFGVQTGTTTTPNTGFPSGGFPVINYEPTGLTLKFTPLVYPNFDVQVKMSIESKDVTGASTLTPTFTERTITGTARVQNNRTMMLASVSTTVESNGRQGLPVLGGLPIFGRLFASPTRESRQVDIVIAVTPRVLRAPAVTPRDEEMRPSGTLSNPTTGSIAVLIAEADREDQIAAAHPGQRPAASLQKEPSPFSGSTDARSINPLTSPAPIPDAQANVVAVLPPSAPVQNQQTQVAATGQQQRQTEDLSSYVPAPKSLINSQGATEVAALNTGMQGAANAVLTTMPKLIETSVEKTGASRIAQLKLAAAEEPLKVGEKRRVAIELKSDVSLALAVLTLRFDPRVINVRGVSAGTMFSGSKDTLPGISQSIDPSGVCLISISSLGGLAAIKGTGVMLFLDIEAVGAGDSGLMFDKEKTNLVAADASDVVPDLLQGQTTVKQ